MRYPAEQLGAIQKEAIEKRRQEIQEKLKSEQEEARRKKLERAEKVLQELKNKE